MNRRELFKAISGVATAAGVPVTASTMEATKRPVLALFESPDFLSDHTCELMATMWEKGIAGTPFEDLRV